MHSRHGSAELLSSGRPLSQGSAAILSGGEVSSHLSAREQEHVARVTGSPLISMAGNKGPSKTQTGLVGAIENREREKAQMKMGIGNHAVAQAIDQRTREQQQQAQRAAQAAYAQQQAQLATAMQGHTVLQSPVGGLGGMGGGGAPSVYAPSMGAMNVRSHSPGPGMMSSYGGPQGGSPGFGPGAGWNMGIAVPPQRPSPGVMTPSPGMGYGMPSPGFQLPPQGQYSPSGVPTGGSRPGTPGRMQFHGQAF
ncbi:hypothetical protein VTK26DRAFT_7363 [Humicola hyalothermophila]